MKRFLLVIGFSGLSIFILVTALYIQGYSTSCDLTLSKYIMSLNHTPLLDNIAKALAILNSKYAILTISILLSGYLLFKREVYRAIFALTALLGTGLATYFIKDYFNRPRPLDRLIEISSPAFPSGHSSTSMALIIVLIVLLYLKYNRAIYWLFLWTLFVGLSRIWLNVHWCSDVVSGWALGAFISSSLALILLKREGK